jgi:hypothetical protein
MRGDDFMKLALNLAAACGLVAFLAMSAPASAASFTYDLVGDTSTAYTDPAFPGYTLNVGDIVQVTVKLNNPVAFNFFEIGLQGANGNPIITFDPTFSYSIGGLAVPAPSSNWVVYDSTRAGLGFSSGFSNELQTFSFDKVIVNAMITSMIDDSQQPISSVDLTELPYPPYAGFYHATIATTPLPGSLLLMTTALGGLGLVARRRRAAA